MPQGEKYKVASKLHRQFCHPHGDKIKALLRDAEIIDDELEKHMFYIKKFWPQASQI